MERLAVVWRNPKRVQHQWRWRQIQNRSNLNIYVVEELVSAKNDFWVDSTALELIRTARPRRPQEAGQRSWTFGLLGERPSTSA